MNWYILDKGSFWCGELRMVCVIIVIYDKVEEFCFCLLGFFFNGIVGLLLFNSMFCFGLFFIFYMFKCYFVIVKFFFV